MTRTEVWQQVDRLFREALEVDPENRRRFLRERCDSDVLRAQVERMLEGADDPTDRLSPGGALTGEFGEDLRKDLDQAHDPYPGTRLGGYAVHELLGAGGMGRVYRAHDSQLERWVAIKVLGEFARDPERLARFEREAKLLASLNHPNIAAIYGVEEGDDTPFLVLEIVEGPLLSEVLRRGALPLGKAIEIALQLTQGLEAAHAKGIVHRDLKPGNIKLNERGEVKVLDFGLAKMSAATDHGAPKPASGDTQTGVIVGTAAYMSPEQARGQLIDKRSDIWAFGCLLYEMLTGRRAFGGETPSDTLASILRSEPDYALLPPETPKALDRLIRRCLHKDPHQRLQDIGDARIEMNEWLDALPDDAYSGAHPRTPARRFALGLLPWLAAALALSVGLFSWLSAARDQEPSARPMRLLIGADDAGGFIDNYSPVARLAPDGQRLVFVGREGSSTALYLRELDSLEPRLIPGTEGAMQPFFSPEGQWIAFLGDRKLRKVAVDGGSVLDLAEVGGNLRGGVWLNDSTIVLSPNQTSGLLRIDDDGGELQPLTALDLEVGERSHRWPQRLPGDGVLFTSQLEGTSFEEARIMAWRPDLDRPKLIVAGGAHGRYVDTGHLLFVRSGQLFIAPFDLASLELEAQPEPIVEGVEYDPRNGGAQYDVASDGTLLYRPGQPLTTESRPVWVGLDGRQTPVMRESSPREYAEPRFSPDGSRLLVRLGRSESASLWTVDLDSGSLSQLTFSPAVAGIWSASGQAVTYAAPTDDGQLNIFHHPLGGKPERLTQSRFRQLPSSWVDDDTLLYQERRPDTGWDLLALRYDDPSSIGTAVLESPHNEANPTVSIDQRFMAYESDELDAVVQVYVRSYPDLSRKWQISTEGGRYPVWSRSTSQLLYWNTGESKLMIVDYSVEDGNFQVLSQRALQPETPNLRGHSLTEPSYPAFDFDGGRQQLVMLEPSAPRSDGASEHFVVVLNWFEEIEGRSPTR